MGFKFRMKTGFYETKMYDLTIRKGGLVLSPTELEDLLITIPEENILNISLKGSEKFIEVEIQTNKKDYQGLLVNKADYELLLEQLKENISKKIICEYNGGY